MAWPRVDDRRVVSGVVDVIRNGLQWKDAPKDYGSQDALQPLHPVEPVWRLRPHLRGPRGRRPKAQTHHDRRVASEGASHGGQSFKKGAVFRRIGRTKGGLNSKLPVVCDGARKPLVRLMRDTLPAASTLLADRGYDSNGFRQALEAKSVRPAFRRPKAAKRRSAPLFVSMKAAISQHI